MNAMKRRRSGAAPAALVTVILIVAAWVPAAGEAETEESGSPYELGMPNPAAYYCRELGYEYETVRTEGGARGLCVLPTGERVDAWEFFRGRIAQEHSYCPRLGYRTATRTVGDGDDSGECAICVDDDGTEIGTVWELMDLGERMSPATAGLALPATAAPTAPRSGATSRALPESFNWCDVDGCTPIKDQENCGSCWAFSAVGAFESAILIKDGVETDLSEQWLVSCNSDGWNCTSGYFASRYHHWKTDPCGDTGAVFEDDCPYHALDLPCECPYVHEYTLVGWGHVAGRETVPTPDQIKEALLRYGPLDVAVLVDEAFSDYLGGIFELCDNYWYPNHTVNLVGWDDTQGTEGIWILRNCWGTGWGEDGFMRIAYWCSNVGFGACWVAYRDPLRIELPDGAPVALVPGEETVVTVRIEEVGDALVPGSARLHYRYGGDDFASTALVPLGGDLYAGTLPPADCLHSPEFYVAADTETYGTTTMPMFAPDETYACPVGALTTVVSFDFETNAGWVVVDGDNLIDGSWERGVPVGGGLRGDPPTDHSGSGSCYVTGNEEGNSDVDGGSTRLFSPEIEVPPDGEIIVNYALWYTNSFGNNPNEDPFRVYLRQNGGTWVLVEIAGPKTPLPVGWHVRSLVASDHIDCTDGFWLRFDALDEVPYSVVEAGIDDVAVYAIDCDPTGVPEGVVPESRLALRANVPNPFATTTSVRFEIPTAAPVDLSVYDASGRLVRTLLSSEGRSAGAHSVSWDGRDNGGTQVASGTYFARLTVAGETVTRKATLLR